MDEGYIGSEVNGVIKHTNRLVVIWIQVNRKEPYDVTINEVALYQKDRPWDSY